MGFASSLQMLRFFVILVAFVFVGQINTYADLREGSSCSRLVKMVIEAFDRSCRSQHTDNEPCYPEGLDSRSHSLYDWVESIYSKNNLPKYFSTQREEMGGFQGSVTVVEVMIEGKAYFFRQVEKFYSDENQDDFFAVGRAASAQNMFIGYSIFESYFSELGERHLPKIRLAYVDGIPGLLMESVDGILESKIKTEEINLESLAFTEVFEYLIGNADLVDYKNLILDHEGNLIAFDLGMSLPSGRSLVQPDKLGGRLPEVYPKGFLEALVRFQKDLPNISDWHMSEDQRSGLNFRAELIIEDARRKGQVN